MSNAYVNQILFGNSKRAVTAEYIQSLLPLMLTDTYIKECSYLPTPATKIEDPVPATPTPVSNPKPTVQRVDPKPTVQRVDPKTRTIFWSIYELENPEEAFLRPRANIEIEHRIKVIDVLKKTPKRLKDTNSKLTVEQTQSLFGAMLTAKEDRVDFCIAYAAYYNKPIVIVYPKSYCVYSPTTEVDLSEDVIILYASKPEGARSISYAPERGQTQSVIAEIVRTKTAGPLKAISTYKTAELDEIATRLRIEVKHIDAGKEKRRKKEDIYNDIRVSIHNDMNFTQN